MYDQPIGPEEKTEPIAIDTEMLCNCYLYSEIFTGIDLPPMAVISPNTESPIVGGIAIMQYGAVKHVAVITEITKDTISVTEGNYHRCQKTERTLSKDYQRLVGFYTPG